MELNKSQQTQLASIAKRYKLRLIFLFGSYAKGTQTAESDFDIAVLAKTYPSAKQQIDLISDLTKIFRRNVDLTIINRSSALLKMQVVKNSQLLYGGEKDAVRFRSRAISEYLDTAKLRQLTQEYLARPFPI